MAIRTSRNRPRPFLTQHPERLLAFLVSTCVFSAAFILFAIESRSAPKLASEETLRIWFFDIGQGDATFIELPTGEQILIDGGRDDAVLAKLGQVMPPWDRTLDAVVATHPDADHIAGLPSVLARYEVAAVYDNGDSKDTGISRSYDASRDGEPGAVVDVVREGEEFVFGDVVLTAVWPRTEALETEDTNDASVVYLLQWRDTTVLLTGDATAYSEEAFAQQVGDIDVLKVGHHGSITSTTEFLLDAVTPEAAVISAGVNNSYGHPHPGVLGRLEDHGIQIFRTDLDGDVLLLSHGGEPTVEPAPLPF